MDLQQVKAFAKFWSRSVPFFATIPSFLALTANYPAEKRRRMAKHAAWTCFSFLSSFALAGSLLLVAMEMFEAKRSGTQESEAELPDRARFPPLWS